MYTSEEMKRHSIFIGKAIKRLAQLRGGGSALPGLVIEKLDKQFLKQALHQLPQGVILITGTNGKTTTTKIVAELLRSQGLKVFTNHSGSNFTRGIIATLLGAMDHDGHLDYDIAVLELDEAYATHFIKQVPPDYVLVLNVMRDQLDRFGEIDHTAKLLEQTARAATKHVVLNRDDPRVARIAGKLEAPVSYFGATADLHELFVSDDNLYGGLVASKESLPADVELLSFKDRTVTYKIGKQRTETTLQLSGVYNFLNAAGALAIVRQVLRDVTSKQFGEALSHVTPAFGRGEIMMIDGRQLELVLVKNPSGFRLSLASFKPDKVTTMIAINDLYADGRDMSWLWDVDFSTLKNQGVAVVSGVRAYDMALRLQYDDVPISLTEPQLDAALKQLISASDQPMRIFCTYTAMLSVRRLLKKYTHVERAL